MDVSLASLTPESLSGLAATERRANPSAPMKRLLFPAFVVAGATFLAAACDPDLTPRVTPGTEGGASEGGALPTGDADTPEGDGGNEDSATGDGGSDGSTHAAHTIDGTNDFTADEKLPTTSPLYNAYVSWDDTNVYFGMEGADVGANTASKWVLIYVDGSPTNGGSSQGLGYGCSGACTVQKASLAFDAGFHIRWKTDGSYSNLQKWSGTAWIDGGPINTFARTGNFMEMSVSRFTFGKPTNLKVDMFMLIEQTGAEWTYSGIPSTAFTDGKAPASIAKYLDFDLTNSSKAPNTYAPLP